jgi:two-component system response regulator AtoC
MIKRVIVLESEESVLSELSGNGSTRRMVRGDFYALLEEVADNAGAIPLREVSRRAVLEVEKEVIGLALDHSGWNRKKAAERLGVSYKTLLHKIRNCELDVAG